MNSAADRIRDLCLDGHLEEAWNRAEDLLDVEPNNPTNLILASYVCWKLKKTTVAYHLAIRATQIAPHESAAWCNLGINSHELWLTDQSEEAYRTSYRLAKDDAAKGMAAMNLAALYIDTGRWVSAEEWSRIALKHAPDSAKAKANLGFSCLGQRKWAEGWEYYSYSLGLESRKKMKLKDEPDWDGTEGLSIALYGEQGLGDEISFASMINDAIRVSKKVVIDCDKKLAGLFARSFPSAKVYGTRNAKSSHGVQWDREDWDIDASAAFGELGGLFRNADSHFTGEPYLAPDPIRASMWHQHFAGKPAMGIAWSGGLRHTGSQFRRLSLDELYPILRSVDARWVSLQYTDASAEIDAFRKKHPEIDIVQYPWATLTDDYDDTAALVSQLDRVISVDTAVVHLAGALGKECIVMLHKYSQWRYGDTLTTMPWYKSLSVVRQGVPMQWDGVVGKIVEKLQLKEAA